MTLLVMLVVILAHITMITTIVDAETMTLILSIPGHNAASAEVVKELSLMMMLVSTMTPQEIPQEIPALAITICTHLDVVTTTLKTLLLPSNAASAMEVLITPKVWLMMRLQLFVKIMTLSVMLMVIPALPGTTSTHQDVVHMMMMILLLLLPAASVEEEPLMVFQLTLLSQPLQVASTTTLLEICMVILAPCGTIHTQVDVVATTLLISLLLLPAALAEEVTMMDLLLLSQDLLAILIFQHQMLMVTLAHGMTFITEKIAKELGILLNLPLLLNAALAEVDHTDHDPLCIKVP